MNTLTAAGVQVSVNDISTYAEPNPTTIPVILVATRANKANPDGSGTAPGTTESGQLRVVTSQRELITNYGNPVFVSSDGEPVHGEETNEYGLLAAHTFLGRGSRAFILRADIDLAGLVPTVQEPVLPPPDNLFWVRSDTVVGGIFRFDGTTWAAVPFSVFTTTPGNGDGVDGDWSFDYSSLDGTLRYKEGGSWKAASDTNLVADFGASTNLHVQPTSPTSPDSGDYWYKTTASSGGVNLQLTRFRAVDGVFVKTPIIRQTLPPVANQGTVWEDLSQINTTGARPIFVGTGANFIPLEFVVQANQPVTEPGEGTLWYDDTFTDFAMYVEGTDQGRGNEWVPVTTTTVSNPTATQKVISASPPTFPQEGSIWVDISSPETFDDYPVIKRYQADQFVDISGSIIIQSDDPLASAVVNGTYWLNTGESSTRNTVKIFDSNFTANKVVLNDTSGKYEVVEQVGNFWRPNAGDQFGRKAVRDIVVERFQSAVIANDDLRAESNYFQLVACPGYPEVYDDMVALNNDNGETGFVVGDTPKFMIPNGIPSGREVTSGEWATNANNVEQTGEKGFASGRSPYSAFYYPWCLTGNLDGENVFAPPSHMALRAIAFSDSTAAPWFPPAGSRRGRVDNADSVGYLNNDGDYNPLQITPAMQSILYEVDINPIMSKPNQGLTIMGQKTWAASASALDRINVSRLLAKMKYDLQRLLEPFLFEINDAITQRSALVTTERYLAGLKSLRALFDYAARCDTSNNTPDRIDRNELYVDVAIKPAKAIEFIYVPITVLGTGDEFPF